MALKYKNTPVRKPRSADSKHYVNNKEFHAAFVEYKKKIAEARAAGKPDPKLPDYIGLCFMKISEKLSHQFRFIKYGFRDEMISDAIENCVMYAHDYNPEKGSNPFAYFTQVAWHAFIRRINKENKNKYITYKSHQLQSIQNGGQMGSTDDDNPGQSQELYENITEYIDEYERKVKEKKLEKRKKMKESQKTAKAPKKAEQLQVVTNTNNAFYDFLHPKSTPKK